MAKVTRIKAKDDGAKAKKTQKKPADEAEVTRKVRVSAKNSANKKLAKKQAEKVKSDVKAEKVKKTRKVPAILKPIWFILTPVRALVRYIRESFREIRQVRWPNRKETWKMTLSVIIYVIIVAGFIMLMDALLTIIFNQILG